MATTDLLYQPEVSKMTGIPVATLKYWRQDNRGPRSFRLSDKGGRAGRVVYRRSDVEAWIDAQDQASGAGSGVQQLADSGA
jgi:predicted DNA-binding transcriptional regulator AlpA